MNIFKSLFTSQSVEVFFVGFVVLVVMSSLAYTLWKSLSETAWTLYWHMSSFLTAFGAITLAVAASRVVTNNFVVNSALTIVVLGVFTALLGAFFVMIHSYRSRRDF